MRVAIVHDYLTQYGGAERVVLSLARRFPDAPIFTSVYDPDGTYPEFRRLDVRTTWLQRLPHRGRAVRALLPLYPGAFERMRLRGYDLVISSSSGWAHGVDAGDAHHAVYCYTPARWLYLTDRYLDGRAARLALGPLLGRLRDWDERAARRPDRYVAISGAVAERIERVYGRRPNAVVHPPVQVERLLGTGASSTPGDHYLLLARALPYKRIDLAVDACTRSGRRLVVVGDGPLHDQLVARSGPTVEFRRRVDDGELAHLLARCRGLIQAGEEDFGLAPLEANAAGRPAVAYRAGGATETVVDGTTGVLFDEPSVDGLLGAMERLERTSFDADVLRRHAATFGEDRFHAELDEALGLGPMIDLREPGVLATAE